MSGIILMDGSIEMNKLLVTSFMVVMTGLLMISTASAYEAGPAGQGVIQGTITFNGTPPPPKIFDLTKFPQPRFCGEVDNDGGGHRVFKDVTVNNGRLQDVIVYLQDITRGKPFHFNGTDVTIDHCRFLVQGGPSTMIGVVMNGGVIRILNEDADPTDPHSITGVLHNPHGYEVKGHSSSTLFNKPIPSKGQLLTETIYLHNPGSTMLLQGDQNNYMNAFFYPVENPYYAIVGPDGTYVIDQVPPGKYNLIAWHPTLGTQEKEIEVGVSGTVTVNFEFSTTTPSPHLNKDPNAPNRPPDDISHDGPGK
ncbi:MAG TPA: carboxypeptidase-like regulatory domain-containing protein [Nitrospiria bacterium]|nr:carboxypeptidase-like regulatory domain-containing protein [Nitrospiria bacterium]